MSDKPQWVFVPAGHAVLVFPCCPEGGCDCKPEHTD